MCHVITLKQSALFLPGLVQSGPVRSSAARIHAAVRDGLQQAAPHIHSYTHGTLGGPSSNYAHAMGPSKPPLPLLMKVACSISR